jgi:hypothetical protein
MSRTEPVAHDPSAPAGHLPGLAREEQRRGESGVLIRGNGTARL